MANKEQAEGRYDRAKGRIKEAAGDLTGDNELKAEGMADRAKGAVKEGVGNVKKAINNATADDT